MGIKTALYFTGKETEPGRVVVQYHYESNVYGKNLRAIPIETLNALLPQNPIKFSFLQVKDETVTQKINGVDHPALALEEISAQEATIRNFRPAVINRLERSFTFHKAQIRDASAQIQAVSREYHQQFSYIPKDELNKIIAQDDRIIAQRFIATEGLRETGSIEYMLSILKYGELI